MLYLLFVVNIFLLLWLIVFLLEMDNQDQGRTRTRTPGAFSLKFKPLSLPLYASVVILLVSFVSLVQKSLSFLGFLEPGLKGDDDHGVHAWHSGSSGAVEDSNPSDKEHLSDNDPHSLGNESPIF